MARVGKGLRLTGQGHATARKLAGLPGVGDALDLLAAVAACPARWTQGWVSEPSLAGLEAFPRGVVGECRFPDDGRLSLLLATADALVLEGLLRWRPFRLGWDFCLYEPTPAGRGRAAEGDAARWFGRVEAAKAIPLPEPPEPYGLAFAAAYRNRETARPRWPNRIGHLDPVDAPRAAV